MNNDLELSILSCLLQKPELMEEVILEDKHFKNNYKLWKFMQSFYKKFHNFDVTLMCSVVDKRYKLIDYIKVLIDLEPNPNLFKEYQEQLLKVQDTVLFCFPVLHGKNCHHFCEALQGKDDDFS